jgi:hypothetical protein
MRQGPTLARVSDLAVTDEPIAGDMKKFEVRW